VPDNFIDGESLRDAILIVEPGLAGRIGSLGHFRDGTRYLIAPYVHYQTIAERSGCGRRLRQAKLATGFHLCRLLRRWRGFQTPNKGGEAVFEKVMSRNLQ
jgi:hypothetical protein